MTLEPFSRSLTGSRERPVVTLARRYAAPPRDVWDALTDPVRLTRWLGAVERDALDPDRVTVRVADAPDSPAEARVRSCVPPETLLLDWEWDTEEPSVVAVTLRADGEGTFLTLEHRLGEPDHAADYGGGWEQHLGALVALFGGEQPAPATSAWAGMTARPLEIEIDLPRTPEEVWPAFASASGLRRWWWNHWDDVEIAADVRPGGSYRFAAPGAGIVVEGRYLAVEAPSHLAFTWRWSDADGQSVDEACDLELLRVGGGCRVRLRHTGPWSDDAPAESYRQGWEFVFGALRRAVDDGGAA